MNQAQNDMLIETHTLTCQVHEAMFGNGKPGIKAEMERLKGGYTVFRALCIVTISISTILVSVAGLVVATVLRAN